MDIAYLAKLEQVADAPDSFFPTLVFAPLENDFGDTYFKIGIEDYQNEAIKVDPRFTRQRISRIRGTTKRIEKFLEWSALWDDYMHYITTTYGSYEMAEQLNKHGLLPDPLPSVGQRPQLRKGLTRKLFAKGIVPSFQAYGIDTDECCHRIAELYSEPDPELLEGGEPDIEWSLSHKPDKAERKAIQRSMLQYRRRNRQEILKSGTSLNGIGSNMDFIDNYYANISQGTFDTQFGPGSIPSLAETFRALTDREFWHMGQILAAEDAKKSKWEYTGAQIRRNHEIDDQEKFTQYLMDCFGLKQSDLMVGKASKKAIKAQRALESELGISDGLSDKQRRKLRRRQEKLDRSKFKVDQQDEKLSQVLLNNKLFLNNGILRFEDGQLGRYGRSVDDDDDY